MKILRMGQREQKQELMAEVFQQDRNRGVSDRHRLAPRRALGLSHSSVLGFARPWQARNFEQLPKAGSSRPQLEALARSLS